MRESKNDRESFKRNGSYAIELLLCGEEIMKGRNLNVGEMVLLSDLNAGESLY
jgi:hypothetical protein